MFEFTLSAESIAMIAGVVLSLVFSYIPGLRVRFDLLNAEQKRLVMLVLVACVTAGSFGLACAGVISGLECSQTGAYRAVGAFILAVIANQSTYAISPRVG